MKKFIAVKERKIETQELTALGNQPANAVEVVVKDSETGELWHTIYKVADGLNGERFLSADGQENQILMPVYESQPDNKPAKLQCFVTTPDWHKLSLLTWGGAALPTNFDLLDVDSNPASDMHGALLQNRLTGVKVIGQAGALKSCEQ